jgi:hypothetical protein
LARPDTGLTWTLATARRLGPTTMVLAGIIAPQDTYFKRFFRLQRPPPARHRVAAALNLDSNSQYLLDAGQSGVNICAGCAAPTPQLLVSEQAVRPGPPPASGNSAPCRVWPASSCKPAWDGRSHRGGVVGS